MIARRSADPELTAGRSRCRARNTGAMAVLLLLYTSLGALAESPAPTDREKSSLDDCRVIVQAGKHQLGWSSTAAPPYDFYPRFGNYVEDCSWKELGVAEPRPGNRASLSGFYITPPAYDGSSATVEIHTFRRDNEAKDAAPAKSRFTDAECKLERDRSEWSIRQCVTIENVTSPRPRANGLTHPFFK
jgi:hypothetical protein